MAKVIKRTKVLDKDVPYVVYSSKALRTMLCMLETTHAKNKEFMFLGMVEKHNNEFYVNDFYLVPQQKCSGTYCETDDEKYPIWLAENIAVEDRRYIRLHGHSHVNMATTPSGTDNAMIEDLVDNVSDFYIQLIINHNLQNTVTIWDKDNIYSDIEQYIDINGNKIKLINKNTLEVASLITLTNNMYRVENNELVIDTNTRINLITGQRIIYDDYVSLIVNNDKSIIKVLDIGNEYHKEVEQTMTDCVKNEFTYTKSNDYTFPSYYESYDKYYGKYNYGYDYDDYDLPDEIREQSMLEDLGIKQKPKKKGKR